ncbi:MAG: thioredoxin domain-containing protein [Candidatus Rhabdochlamydia sp.]
MSNDLPHASCDQNMKWYPWEKTTFYHAQEQEKLLFLSITYETCHFCHVMEEEVFQHPEVISTLNTNFISIRIDKDLYPEVSSFYMQASERWLKEKTGWPLNLILTPDLVPLTAFTYLPLNGSLTLPSFLTVVKTVEKKWRSSEKNRLLSECAPTLDPFQENRSVKKSGPPLMQDLEKGVEAFLQVADFENGGIKNAAKFPLAFHLEFLLKWGRRRNHSKVMDYVLLTADRIARGGLHDVLGGGFFRYAVDEEWLFPHFEKTLYDNALLARSFLLLGRSLEEGDYESLAFQTLDYLICHLKAPCGGFYAGEDSGRGHEEEMFYTWTAEEVLNLLPGKEGEIFCSYYNVMPHLGSQERSTLYVDMQVDDVARGYRSSLEYIKKSLAHSRDVLLKKQNQRKRPQPHTLVITGYNGLAIDALALAGGLYLDHAIKAASFIRENLFQEGTLFHAWREGEVLGEAVLEDYACFIKGIITLFEMTGDQSYLQQAIDLTDHLEKEFKREGEGFYQTAHRHESVTRMYHFHDDAYPSGNSVHAENLVRLHLITGENRFQKQVEEIFQGVSFLLKTAAPLCFYQMSALFHYLDSDAKVIMIQEGIDVNFSNEVRDLLQRAYLPHVTMIFKKAEALPSLERQSKELKSGFVMLCEKDRCNPCLTKYEEVVKLVDKLKKNTG